MSTPFDGLEDAAAVATGTDPQRAVAAARARVLGGRGPGASSAEIARVTRDRPTLGALPAPLERELVRLDVARIRAAEGDLDTPTRQNQIDRVRQLWTPTHVGPTRAAVSRSAGAPGASGSDGLRRFASGLAGVFAGMAIAVLARPRSRSGR